MVFVFTEGRRWQTAEYTNINVSSKRGKQTLYINPLMLLTRMNVYLDTGYTYTGTGIIFYTRAASLFELLKKNVSIATTTE